MAAARIGLKTLLVTVTGIAAVELVSAGVMRSGAVQALVVTGVARVVEMLLIASVLVRMENGFEAVGVSPATAVDGFRKGLVWSGGFGLLVAVGVSVMVLCGTDPLRLIQTAMPPDAVKILLVFVVGGFIGPVVEEFFFRGMLYGYCRRWGVIPAVFLSTLVFVSLHPVKAFALIQAVGGVLFAAAYEIERNLLVPIVIHVLGNLALFSVALVF